MAWVETESESFVARHADGDADDAVQVLNALEDQRSRLLARFPEAPAAPLTIVLHDSQPQLLLARPVLPVVRRLTSPAGRRYLVGWFGRDELHVLAPRRLAQRASNVPGSVETLMLAPAALYAQLVVSENNPAFPPPYRLALVPQALRWAWLIAGSGQHLSGQAVHARPIVTRRLHEGRRPSFPPGVRDAVLLGGTVLDLLGRDRGDGAVAELLLRPPTRDVRGALRRAFGGMSWTDIEAAWREHLGRLAAA